MALHENIKTRRTALKLSQEYVAERVGVSRQAVAKWETGKSVPASAHLARLAEVLETSVAALAGGEHEERARSVICRNAGMLIASLAAMFCLTPGGTATLRDCIPICLRIGCPLQQQDWYCF